MKGGWTPRGERGAADMRSKMSPLADMTTVADMTIVDMMMAEQ